MKRTRTVTHWGTYDVLVEDGQVVALEPAAEDAAPSPIGSGMASAQRDAVRIAGPMIREGWLDDGPGPAGGRRGSDRFVPVSWDVALTLVADELARIRRLFGNEAIFAGSYGWASAGRFHHAQGQVHRFMRGFGGYTDRVNTYSVGAMEVILPRVIGGGPMSIWSRGATLEDIANNGQLVVAFGGMAAKNASVDPGGVSSHVSVGLQQRCRDAGVRFVNVSPQRTDVSDGLEGEWLPIRPGTDVALMLGLAHELVATGRHDREFLERCCVGFEPFRDYLLGGEDGVPKDAAWAADVTEVDVNAIRTLAERIAGHRTVINVSWSIQRMHHGEQTHWMGVVLAAMSGSLGRPGGGFAAGLGIGQVGVRYGRPNVASLPQGRNPVEQAIPVARVSDMLLGPGESYEYNGQTLAYPDIRLVYWVGGNPFHHQQDLHRLVRAWQRPETIIVHEPWWNANARFADVVLPIATMLEREDIAIGSTDLVLAAMHRAVDPPPGICTDYEIFSELAERLGFAASFTEGRDANDWVRELYERTRADLGKDGIELPTFEIFWEQGSVTLPPAPEPTRGSFARLREDPECHPLDTPSGKIEITSQTIASFGYEDCPGHPTWMAPREWLGGPLSARFPLHLVSNQPKQRLHSQYDNGSYSLASKVAGREPVLIHPSDAEARGIESGDTVKLFNERGACLAGAVVTGDVRSGVVVLSTGAWFDPEQPGVSGTLDRHGNPNVLTADFGTSSLAQGSSAGTTLVELKRVDAATAPTPRAFLPPLTTDLERAAKLLAKRSNAREAASR